MNRIYTIFALLICSLVGGARNYYVSNAGNNGNTGLDINHTWLTVQKVNAMWPGFAIGDSVLFKCGDTFYGQLVAGKSGSTASPIVIGSYSTGPKPILSAFCVLHTWTLSSGSIWQCTPDSTLKKNVNVVTFAGVPQAVGRTPWAVYQSATAGGVLSSTALSTAPNYVGAEIVSKMNAFVVIKGTITGQTTGTLTYLNNTQPLYNGGNAAFQTGRSNYGYFIQRFAGSLDQHGEWFFDKTPNLMKVFSTVNPNTLVIKASYIDTLILIGNKQNIILYNLSIEGAGSYGVEAYGATNIQVKNCTFNANTMPVYMWNTNDAWVSNCNLVNSLSAGIHINGNSNQVKRINVLYDTLVNTGQLIGNGVYNKEYVLRGIVAQADVSTASNYVNIIGNVVINTGNGAIQYQGSNVLVRRNIADIFCNELQDNGGIYSFCATLSLNTTIFVNRTVDSNFVSHAIGSPQGENGNVDVTGFYQDDQVLNLTLNHNTVYGIPGNGIQFNDPLNINTTDNTVYDCSYMVYLSRVNYGLIQGNRITRNIFYQKNASQYHFLHVNVNLSRSPAQTVNQTLTDNLDFTDSNWISNLRPAAYKYYFSATGNNVYTPFPADLSLAQWRTYGHDVHSILPPTVLTATNSTLYTNPTALPRVVNFLLSSKVDPKGNVFNNTITIPPWSSVILIDNGPAIGVNKLPVANAGSNQVVQLPVNTASLTGSASDSDGVVVSYAWTQISGPNTATFGSANAPSTTLGNLIAGIYQFRLTVTDNSGGTGTSIVKVTVNAPVNVPPTVTVASSSITIQLPVNTATVTGFPVDSDGTIALIAWTKIAGGTGGTIASPNTASTAINALQQGVYQYKITVTDNSGATASATVQITVLAPVVPNIPPTASAGTDIQIQLPINTATLAGSAADADGTFSIVWTKVSGGTGGDLSATNITNPVVSNLQEGVYKFQITVTDDDLASTTDQVTITVLAPVVPNQIPTVNAGTDSTVVLPVNISTLVGYAVDEDSILTYHWVKMPGSPAGGDITHPDSASSPITNLVEGIYLYELTATDSLGASGTDLVQVIVKPAVIVNEIPVVVINMGNSVVMTMPVNSATLTGVVTDDGNIVSYLWEILSGPTSINIVTPDGPVTDINSLGIGTYQLQLTAVDNLGGIGKGVVTVVVLGPIVGNVPPVVSAGPNRTITAPTSTITITGTASDSDGSIFGVQWLLKSGPPGGTVATPTTLTTIINALQQGQYVFELTATDDMNATGSSTMTIDVLPQPANINPVATITGGNLTVNLPTSTAPLLSSATDADGTISLYAWSLVSAPAAGGGAITSANSQNTGVTGLLPGDYIYEIKVTDNDGGTGTALLTIHVVAAPILLPPVADAGPSRTITLPKDSVHLTGSGTDADGTISSYGWAKISGPLGGTISSAATAATAITAMTEGTYEYRLTVTDNDGGTATSLVQIIVLPVYVSQGGVIRGYIFIPN